MNRSQITAGKVRSAIRSCEDRIALFQQRLNKPHYSGKKTLKKQIDLEEVKITALRCFLDMLECHTIEIRKAEDEPPLMLKELEAVDGEPVFLPRAQCWVLVTHNPFTPLFTFPDGEQCSARDWYKQVGPAYRRKPLNQQYGTSASIHIVDELDFKRQETANP